MNKAFSMYLFQFNTSALPTPTPPPPAYTHTHFPIKNAISVNQKNPTTTFVNCFDLFHEQCCPIMLITKYSTTIEHSCITLLTIS